MCPFSHGFVILNGVIVLFQFLQAASIHPQRNQSLTALKHGFDHRSSTTVQLNKMYVYSGKAHSSYHSGSPSRSQVQHHLRFPALNREDGKPSDSGSEIITSHRHILHETKDLRAKTLLPGALRKTGTPSFRIDALHYKHDPKKQRAHSDPKKIGHRCDQDILPENVPLRRSDRYVLKRRKRHLNYLQISQHANLANEPQASSSQSYHFRTKRLAAQKKIKHNRKDALPVSSSTTRHSSLRTTEIPAHEHPRTRAAHRVPVEPMAKQSRTRTSLASGEVLGIDGQPVNMTQLRVFFDQQARERDLMKQAQWAYMCLVLLLCLMLWAMWYLGARCRNEEKNHVDFQQNEHPMSMKEILWRKRHYLPMAQEPDWVEVQVCDCGTNPR